MRAHYYDTLQMDIEDKSTGYDCEVLENIQMVYMNGKENI